MNDDLRASILSMRSPTAGATCFLKRAASTGPCGEPWARWCVWAGAACCAGGRRRGAGVSTTRRNSLPNRCRRMRPRRGSRPGSSMGASGARWAIKRCPRRTGRAARAAARCGCGGPHALSQTQERQDVLPPASLFADYRSEKPRQTVVADLLRPLADRGEPPGREIYPGRGPGAVVEFESGSQTARLGGRGLQRSAAGFPHRLRRRTGRRL